MNTKQFIKVTPKGGNKSYVMPAQNLAFYKSQGAQIETPSEAEVLESFPELAPKSKTKGKAKDQSARIAELEKAVAERDETISQLTAELDALKNPSDETPSDETPSDEQPAEKKRGKGSK